MTMAAHSPDLDEREARAGFLARHELPVSLVAGGILLALILAAVVLAPALAPADPNAVDLKVIRRPPSAEHLFGTDAIGRDLFSRVLYGGQVSLLVAGAGMIGSLTFGAVMGMLRAFGPWFLRPVVDRMIDIQLAFPSVVFALLFVTMLGPSPLLLVVLVGVSQAPSVARITRGAALGVVERDYVQWARAVGIPTRRILMSEVLPNITSPLLVELGLRLMWSISLLAGLSFLGYGIQPPNADWGLMVNESRNALTIQPWAVLAPILAIATLSIGGNMFAEGMSRAIGRTEGTK